MMIKALSTAEKTQGEISRQVGCSRSAVSKCLQGKSSERKKCGRKRVATKRDARNWCARTAFRCAGKLPSSGMVMVCLHRDQQPIAE